MAEEQAKERVYRIRFDGLKEQYTNLVSIKTTIAELTAKMKEQAVATGENSREYHELNTQLKIAKDSQREQEKAIFDTTKQMDMQGSTLEKLRLKYNLAIKDLDKNKIAGTEAYEAQKKKVDELRAQIDKLEGSTGRFQRNVGNYKNAFTDAFQMMGMNINGVTDNMNKAVNVMKMLGQGMGTLYQPSQQLALTEGEYSQALVKSETGLQKVTNSIKQLFTSKKEMLAIDQGINGELVKQETGIQKNTLATNLTTIAVKGWNAATNATSAAMKILKVALISTGIGALIVALGSLIAYFASTQAGIDKVNKVLEPLKQIFQRIVGIIQQFGGGLAKIFSGEFREGFKELGKVVGSVGSQLKEAANDGSRLAQITVEIEQARIKLADNEGRIRREIAEQRTILSDIGKSDKERIAAGEKYKQLRNELLAFDKVIANLEFEQATIKAKQNDTDREALAEISRKREAINALEAAALMEQKEAQTQIAGLIKASGAKQAKDAADRIKALDEETKKIQKAQADLTKSSIEEIDKFIAEAEARKDEIQKVVDMFAGRRPEVEEEQPIEESPEIKRAMATHAYRRKLEEETAAAKIAAIRKAIEEGEIAEEEGKKKIQDIRLGQLADYTEMLGRMKGLMKQNTVAYKAVASAEALINTYAAIAKTLKEPTLPFPANIAMSVIIGAQGLMQVANINKVKFAKGGIVGGRSHEQGGTIYRGSDGQQFEVERGELLTVVNKYDTERLRTLSRLNSGHGKSFFATGGIYTPRTDFNNNAMNKQLITDVVNSIAQIPVVVSEREISDSQRRVSVAGKVGDL